MFFFSKCLVLVFINFHISFSSYLSGAGFNKISKYWSCQTTNQNTPQSEKNKNQFIKNYTLYRFDSSFKPKMTKSHMKEEPALLSSVVVGNSLLWASPALCYLLWMLWMLFLSEWLRGSYWKGELTIASLYQLRECILRSVGFFPCCLMLSPVSRSILTVGLKKAHVKLQHVDLFYFVL